MTSANQIKLSANYRKNIVQKIKQKKVKKNIKMKNQKKNRQLLN